MKKAIYTGIRMQPDPTIDQRVFKMEPPLEGFDFVVVSASDLTSRSAASLGGLLMGSFMTEPETYIFGCKPDGDIVSWAELPGSYRGGLSHAKALEGAGYEIVEKIEELSEEQ